jgi:hypothetical protein
LRGETIAVEKEKLAQAGRDMLRQVETQRKQQVDNLKEQSSFFLKKKGEQVNSLTYHTLVH